MEYKVEVSPEFQREFYTLEKNLQERVRKILKKLETRPSGSPLRYELKGFYSVHFENNHYRLIYFKEDNILKILALQVGKRTNVFYKDLIKMVKRGGLEL